MQLTRGKRKTSSKKIEGNDREVDWISLVADSQYREMAKEWLGERKSKTVVIVCSYGLSHEGQLLLEQFKNVLRAEETVTIHEFSLSCNLGKKMEKKIARTQRPALIELTHESNCEIWLDDLKKMAKRLKAKLYFPRKCLFDIGTQTPENSKPITSFAQTQTPVMVEDILFSTGYPSWLEDILEHVKC